MQASSIKGHSIRSPETQWWPKRLTGDLNARNLEEQGFQFYTVPGPIQFWIAMNPKEGRAFFWASR